MQLRQNINVYLDIQNNSMSVLATRFVREVLNIHISLKSYRSCIVFLLKIIFTIGRKYLFQKAEMIFLRLKICGLHTCTSFMLLATSVNLWLNAL